MSHSEKTLQEGGISESTSSMNHFYKQSHFWGRLTLLATILASLSAPLYMFFVVGAYPGWHVLVAGVIGYAGFIGVMWVVEPITYYPILGTAGTYMAFLSGNISNLCLPCSAAAQDAINAEPGSSKAEIAGVFGIAMACLVNTLVIILTIIGGTYLISVLPDAVKDAFDYILPAIFGAVLGQFAFKTPLYGMIGLAIGFLVLLSPVFDVIKTAVGVALTITVILIMQRKRTNQ